jgi:hypothetical protein
MALRKEYLPPWAELDHFNHFYRFATNTSIPLSEQGKVLRVGDVVCLSAETDATDETYRTYGSPESYAAH